MTIDLLELLFVSHFCFAAPVPWWLWGIGLLSSINAGVQINKLVCK